jgi:hypothetical protein
MPQTPGQRDTARAFTGRRDGAPQVFPDAIPVFARSHCRQVCLILQRKWRTPDRLDSRQEDRMRNSAMLAAREAI